MLNLDNMLTFTDEIRIKQIFREVLEEELEKRFGKINPPPTCIHEWSSPNSSVKQHCIKCGQLLYTFR